MTGYFPMLVLEWYYDYFPGRRFRIARDNSKIATQVSKDLIAAKSAAHLDGMEERDVLSLIGMFFPEILTTLKIIKVSVSQSKPIQQRKCPSKRE